MNVFILLIKKKYFFSVYPYINKNIQKYIIFFIKYLFLCKSIKIRSFKWSGRNN